MYALRRVIAAGPGRGCWRLQFRSDVETQIQHPHIKLRSLDRELRGVALCFDASSVQLSIGPRLFLPSGPEQCLMLLRVCLISVHPPNKDLVRVCHTSCVLTVVRRLSSSSFLSSPIALCVSVSGGLILHAYIVLSNNSAVVVRGEEGSVTCNLTLCLHQVVAKVTFNYYFTV